MSLIDIKAVKAEAEAQLRKESSESATGALVTQMRRVGLARKNLKAEEIKLADIEAQIEDGTLLG